MMHRKITGLRGRTGGPQDLRTHASAPSRHQSLDEETPARQPQFRRPPPPVAEQHQDRRPGCRNARRAPAQFNEHEALDVSRRIERDTGSTYRINGREVRARDVHMLFADASTGSRSPALVHQGRIGEIIQAKPEQRRQVL